jgi:Lrp/AsnC family transcriptional regulator, leucine-responsive regulatory protein
MLPIVRPSGRHAQRGKNTIASPEVSFESCCASPKIRKRLLPWTPPRRDQNRPDQPRDPPRLDQIDRRILRALARRARLTNAELAEEVGLSPSPCWTRVRRLEQAGVIKGYVAILDQAALGLPDTVFIEVMLERHDQEILRRFEETVAAIPEVLECHLVTGEYDYVIKAAVGGTQGYEALLREKLYRLPGVRHTRTSFALRCLKQSISPVPG